MNVWKRRLIPNIQLSDQLDIVKQMDKLYELLSNYEEYNKILQDSINSLSSITFNNLYNNDIENNDNEDINIEELKNSDEDE